MVYQSNGEFTQKASRITNVQPVYSGAAAKANQEIINTVTAGASKMYERIQTAHVMRANNEYNLKMNELKSDLMQNKQEKALDNDKLYAEGREKIMGEVLKNNHLHGLAKDAFINTVEKDWVGQQAEMNKYVYMEGEQYQDTQLYNQLANGLQQVSEGYQDVNLVERNIRRGDSWIAARYNDYGQEEIMKRQNEWHSKVYGDAITAAITAKDYDMAEEILKTSDAFLKPELKSKIKKAIKTKRQDDEQTALFNKLYSEGDYMSALEEVRKKPKDPTDQAELEKDLLTFYKAKETERRFVDDQRFDNWSNQLVGWRDTGVPYEQALSQAEEWAGMDVDLLREARSAVKTVYNYSGGTGTGGTGSRNSGGLNYGVELDYYEMISRGAFQNKKELSDDLVEYGANKSEYNRIMKSYDDWKKGDGAFSYNWSNIKLEVLGDKVKGMEASKAWNDAKAAGREFIRDYALKNNSLPSDRDVILACQEGMTKQSYGVIPGTGFLGFGTDELELSRGELLRAGIVELRPLGNGTFDVTDSYGNVTRKTAEQLEQEFK